jgi:alkanesulfonate monooxygenase SsuD/methylene tetrahydromethanopterin reductase-like flavin-dependent oxidoreductase (luciferase family)
MRFAVDVAPLGELADPTAIVRIASTAESAGWDGCSIWDSLGVSMGTAAADPFVSLAGIATVTERLALIASVIALPRRRPHLVAQAAATLDRLAGGRFILGVGAGADPADFELFGESFEHQGRVDLFDRSLALVDRYLRAEAVDEAGISFAGGETTIGPRPVTSPRPPIWIGGMKPGALRRASRWDGWIAISVTDDGSAIALPPDRFAERVATIRAHREQAGNHDLPFDIAVFGSAGLDGSDIEGYAAVGATWWLESYSPMRGTLDQILASIAGGPPA